MSCTSLLHLSLVVSASPTSPSSLWISVPELPPFLLSWNLLQRKVSLTVILFRPHQLVSTTPSQSLFSPTICSFSCLSWAWEPFTPIYFQSPEVTGSYDWVFSYLHGLVQVWSGNFLWTLDLDLDTSIFFTVYVTTVIQLWLVILMRLTHNLHQNQRQRQWWWQQRQQ